MSNHTVYRRRRNRRRRNDVSATAAVAGAAPMPVAEPVAVTAEDVRRMNPISDLVLVDQAPSLVTYLAAFRDAEVTKPAVVKALARAVGAGAEPSTLVKAQILAAAWMTGDGPLFSRLLAYKAFVGYDVAAVAKCVEVVDAPRTLRKALRRLEQLGAGAKAKARAAAKNALNEARQLVPALFATNGESLYGTLRGATGAFAKRVRAWLRGVPEGKLLFYLLTFPTHRPWKMLADVVHAKPSDFASPFFLEVAFGAANPNAANGGAGGEDGEGEGGEVPFAAYEMVRDLDAGAVVEAVEQYPFAARELFSYFRQKFPGAALPDAARAALAARAPLEEVVWYFDELVAGAGAAARAAVEAAVRGRLCAGEGLDRAGAGADGGSGRTNVGKLMQHLMGFHRRGPGAAGHSLTAPLTAYAEARLEAFRASVAGGGHGHGHGHGRVLVCADMSSSMGVAIRTSAVVASLVSSLFNADIVLFNAKGHARPTPRGVVDVLEFAKTRAQGCTSPAAALWPAYAALRDALKRGAGAGEGAGDAARRVRAAVVDLVVVVTDEEENTAKNGFRFAGLFQKYCALAARAGAGGDEAPRCFFVSLLSECSLRKGFAQRGGPMCKELEALHFAPRQFRFSQRRPDLSRLPNLLAVLQEAVKGRGAPHAAGGGGGGGGGGGEQGAEAVADRLLGKGAEPAAAPAAAGGDGEGWELVAGDAEAAAVPAAAAAEAPLPPPQ